MAQTENDDFGSAQSGFLGTLAKEWQQVALEASKFGIRVVTLRIGPVLTPKGGMLALIWPLHYLFSLGHHFGDGRSRLPWVGLEGNQIDLFRVVLSSKKHKSFHSHQCQLNFQLQNHIYLI